jgi:hypothetical protein
MGADMGVNRSRRPKWVQIIQVASVIFNVEALLPRVIRHSDAVNAEKLSPLLREHALAANDIKRIKMSNRYRFPLRRRFKSFNG